MPTRSKGKKKRVASLAGPSRTIPPLPYEVLSEIFIQYVYRPVMDVMGRRIHCIYQQVYTLLAVCTAWRRIGLACPDLWTVVSFADHQDGRQRPLSAPLSLQRAGSKDLHLAMSAWRFSRQRFKVLTGHWHRFSVINIWSNDEDAQDIHQVLLAILKHSPPGTIKALSLRKEETVADIFGRNYPLAPHEPSISSLIKSLAVFRLNNVNLDWTRITFSHRLIDLELTHITIYDDAQTKAFFAALSSAHELKELKLVSVVFISTAKPSSAISLPNLELLHLEHLYFNILQFVISSISPGSYCLTLNPLEETFLDYVSGRQGNPVNDERVCSYLSSIKVQKLILWGQRRFFWSTKPGLTRLLGILPSVKTLIMNYFPTNLNTMAALQRPSGSLHSDIKFPVLTRLEMHGAYVEVPLAKLKPVFDDILKSHQIQHMVFGGVFVVDQRKPITKPLDGNDEVFEWLKLQVPRFTKSPEPSRAPEATDMWRLWDI